MRFRICRIRQMRPKMTDNLGSFLDTPADALQALQGVLNCFDEPAILLSLNYEILLANAAYRSHYGFSDRITRNRHCYRISHHYTVPCDMAGETCPLKESLATRKPSRVLHVHHTPKGEEYVSVEMWPVLQPNSGEVMFFIERMQPTHAAAARNQTDTALLGRSPAFQEMFSLVTRVARAETPVMLQGETGTGKALVAEAIHAQSNRATAPMITMECSGATAAQFETELFGTAQAPGLVEAVSGGTLILDEISEIPSGAQVKLLHLLETRRYRRVETSEWREADFRLVCTTNRDLLQLVRTGVLREDLYYRLSVFEIRIPPLRERSGDLPLLINAMLEQHGAKTLRVQDEAMADLAAYDYPGNLRELGNIIERATLLAIDSEIRREHLPAALTQGADRPSGVDPLHEGPIVSLDEAEQRYLRSALARHRGDRRSLAAKLGLSERALYRKLAALRQ